MITKMIPTQKGEETCPALTPGASILVVDDEVDICSAVARILQLEGFLIQVANSGDQALKLLRLNHYDLLILDMYMPGLSGLELLQQVEQMHLNLAIIIMTGHKEFKDIITTLNSELVTDFLLKPVNNQEIISAVNHALQIQAQRPTNDALS